MAERIVSTSSSSSSLHEEVDEKQSTASSGGDSSSKDNGKSKDAVAKKDKKSKSSTKKDRRDTSRLLGDGVNFKAKLIGVRDVPQARGEKMAQETLQELKALKKSSGERKMKIIINISLEGLKIREEKNKELLYLQPVHKISFISQDVSDNRAFGYIYGSPDNVHTFYAIKTEKAAQQIVMCMRDLFQIAYERKKEEIEKWRMQQAAQQTTNHSPSTSLGSQSSDGSLASNESEKSRDASSPSLNSSNSVYSSQEASRCGGSLEENLNPKNGDPSSLLLDLTIDEPKRTPRNPFDEFSGGDPFFSDPWAYVRSISNDGDGPEQSNVTMAQNDPFNVGPEVQYLSPTRNMNISMASVGQLMSSFNDPFNTSFVSGSLTTPAGDFNSYTSTPVPVSVPVNDGVGIVAGPNLGPSDKKCSLFSEISNIPTASVRDGSDPTDGGTSATVGSSHTNSTEASLLNEGFLANRSEDVSNTEFLVGSDQPLGCSTLIPQQMVPTFAFSDLDPLGKDRPYIDKKDFFQDVKNPPKKVLKDLMAENGFATSDFGFMPAESPVSSFQVSNFDTLSAFPPPNAPPPPLPSSFYRRSLTSPTSSLEDASMAGSASSTSSVESTTSSPVYEVLLPPPPPPPPRPHANMPTFLPPPPPLPPKHNRSPPPECGAGSPTTEAPLPVPSSGMTGVLSSPPIPIPSRRSRGAFTSLSSTSTSLSSSMSMSSSSSNRSSQNGFASDGSVSLNSPAPLEADANNNPSLVPNGYQQQRQQQLSSTTRSSNGIQSWNMNEANTVGNMNKSNMSNPFLGDIFISPPPQHTMGTRRSNGNLGSAKKMQPGIFQKEENPFEDDEFFAALKSVNDTGRTSEGATTPNGNVIGGLWNDPFEDNFAQNR